MKGLRAAFGFFTIIPTGSAGEGLGGIIAAGPWLPVVAVFLGTVEGLAAWGLLKIFGAAVTAALVLALALLLTGLHHTDGLADLGDALMAGGDRTRRRAVLKDRTSGAGAVATLIIIYLITFVALFQLLGTVQTCASNAAANVSPAVTPPGALLRGALAVTASTAGDGVGLTLRSLPWLLIAIEVSARLCLILVAMFSRPSHEGSGSVFMSGLQGPRGAAALLVAATALAASAYFLPDRLLPVAATGAAAVVAIILTAGAKRWFGGANGDVLGAAVELGRMAAPLGLVAVALS